MREFSVRSHLHRAGLGGDGHGHGAAAARVLARDIDNPGLHALVGL
jgi:hypothetical protein